MPVLCGPGPILGLCGDPALSSPSAWPVGAYPCAQPSVNSGESAGASSLAATLHDSGWRNPLSWLFPSELQPLAQPIFGAALLSESAGTSWNPSQALTQPRARTERGGSPVPLIAEPPHCVTTPVASPQSIWGNTSPFAGPHTEADATCAMCDTLCKSRNSEGSQVTVGLHWGFTSAAAHPPDPQGQSSLALPWDGASGAPGPTSWQDFYPWDRGLGCRCSDPGHAPFPHDFTIQSVITDGGTGGDGGCGRWPWAHVLPSQHLSWG